MRYKILSVDDSKTVRIIIKKAFKNYDCEILEASNGVEGLALATKENPDLILLDVTMPVMDGVEMLTKLKSDPALKAIPVIMLTAEGGKDNVLKIAKIGVRDYIVKPFKEDLLVQKVGRIIDLKPITDAPGQGQVHLRSRDHSRGRGQARHPRPDTGRPQAHPLAGAGRDHDRRGDRFHRAQPR